MPDHPEAPTDHEEATPVTKKSQPKAPEPQQPVEGRYQLTLDEFCTRLSTSDSRVSLIGGFFAAEKAAKRNKDTEDAFLARFVVFSHQPA